ncbi:protein phosphatase 2C domain-containing protein [Candidatus Uhrbacteria bacterium]|nr:protein phosphatase 2C domain-containing protein [Candidatus Uhrbacteria bacterium]
MTSIESPDLESPEFEKPKEYQRPFEVMEKRTTNFEVALATVGKEAVNEDALLVTESEAVVFDGMGGERGGEVAARLARDNFLSAYETVSQHAPSLSPSERQNLWQKVLEGNSLIRRENLFPSVKEELNEAADPDQRARGQARRDQARAQYTADLAEAQAAMANLPEKVKLEAIVYFKTMQELSGAIYRQTQANPEFVGMGTTFTGLKIITLPDGRRFGIFAGVGDSEAWLYRKKTNTVEPAVKSDNALDTAVARGEIRPEDVPKLPAWFYRRLRFVGTTQALGASDQPIEPHLRVYELEAGDRFLLNTDGLSDNDPAANFKKELQKRQKEPWKKVAQKMIKQSFRGISSKKEEVDTTVKGADDITVVVGEIGPPPREETTKWNLLVNEELIAAGLSDLIAEEIRAKLKAVEQSLAQEAMTEVKRTGDTSPEAITASLRNRVRAKIQEWNPGQKAA